jgi:hypothetical protein
MQKANKKNMQKANKKCQKGLRKYAMLYKMKFFKNLIKRITETQPKPMGRWNVENCDKKLNQKIDLSNEDHCGPCGQYRIDKLDEPIKNPNKK